MGAQKFLPSLVGSMSVGAAGNPTVEMVEAAFRHHGLHWRYVNMEVPPAGLADAVRGVKPRAPADRPVRMRLAGLEPFEMPAF